MNYWWIVIWFIIGLISLVPNKAGSQELFPIHLDDKIALPTNVIYNVVQDSSGFIWMATDEGLLQYDGNSYKIYKSIIQTSIPGSCIQIDKYGRVWYENFDGYLYYVMNGKLKGIVQRPPSDFVPYGITDKYLFVVQKKGVDVFDLQTLKFIKTIVIPNYLPEHATVKNNNYYIITDHIIYKIDDQLNLISQPFFKEKNFRIKFIYPYKDRLYVISKNNEDKRLYFFDDDLNYVNSITIPHVNYIQGSNVINGNILILTTQGVYTYNENGELLLSKGGLLSNYSISSLIKDYQNNYWVSTINNGVFIIPDMENKLYRLNGYLPLVIHKTNNGYWVGTQTGELLQLDDSLKLSNVILQNETKLPIEYIYYDSLGDYSVLSSKGFYLLKNNSFSNQEHINVALKQLTPVDHKYLAYAASGYAVLYKKPNSDKHQSSIWDNMFEKNQLDVLQNSAYIIENVRAKSIDYNPSIQKLVIATNTGLYTVTPHERQEILMNKNSFYASKVFWYNNDIYALDTKGNLFIIKDGKTFELLNSKLGVEAFEIKNVKRYGDLLIISGSQFLSIYNPTTQKLHRTNINFGINTIRDFILVNDDLLLLTADGILKVPMINSSPSIMPRFIINSIMVNEKVINQKQFKNLSYNQNNIKIDFSLLEYAGNHIPLLYRINNGPWISTNKQNRKLEFPSLAPGKYILEFLVGDQIQSENVVFEIGIPFWKAWWFYLSLIALIGLILYFYFKRESILMRRQISLLNDKVELEKNLGQSVLTSIKSQMNPHFFYNALNTIQAYIFTNNKEKANTYLAKFSKLTRIILEMSEKETVELKEELDSLKIYLDLEKMRFKDHFIYDIKVANAIDLHHVEIPPMLVQPYVENAIKHGLLHRTGLKELLLSYELMDDVLKVVIDDNGIGRAKASELNAKKIQRHQPFALKANEKRLEILNQMNSRKINVDIIDKCDENKVPTGTRVEIFIPIYQ